MIEAGALVADRYQVEDRLGAGGMGAVYLAHDQKLDRPVALKVLDASDVGDASARARLLREARSAARLEHPGIVQVFDVGETEDGDAFLVMERIKGRSLRDILREGSLPWDDLVRVVSELSDALATAHENGVVHRDVKPDNAMLRDDGRAVLLDFGIVKRVAVALSDTETPNATAAALTQSGAIVGTPAYLAPEQARGRSVAATDQWALAVTVFELLAGRLPWDGTDTAHMIAQILLESPADLSTLVDGLPEGVDTVLSRALEKDPDARYPDVRAFADALADAFAGTAPEESDAEALAATARAKPAAKRASEPAPTPAPVQPEARRWPWPLALLAALLVGGGAFWAYGNTAGAPAPTTSAKQAEAKEAQTWTVAVMPFEVLGPPDLQYVGPAFTRLVSAKLELVDVIHTVDARALRARVGTEVLELERASEVARELGATHFVLGEVVATSEQLEVIVRLYDRQREVVATIERDGSPDELPTLTERVAAELIAQRSDLPNRDLTRAAGSGTQSVEAMRAYVAGEMALADGEYIRAVDEFQSATSADPEFALAYFRLSAAYQWLNDHPSQMEALDEALARRESLSPRIVALIETTRDESAGRYEAALRRVDALVRSYPTYVAAWELMGEIHMHVGILRGRSIMRAREPFERANELEPGNRTVVDHLIWIALLERDGDRAAELAATLPDELASIYTIAIELARTGESEHALEAHMLWPALYAVQRFLGHERVIAWGLEEGSPYGRMLAAEYALRLDLAMGRPTRAMAQLSSLEPLVAMEPVEQSMFLSVLPPFRLGEAELRGVCEMAERVAARDPTEAEAIERLVGVPHAGLHPHVGAYIGAICAHRLGDESALAGHLEQLETLPVPEEVEGLGRAWASTVRAWVALESGDAEGALAHLESVPLNLPVILTAFSSIVSCPFSAYVRGEALIALGRHEEAQGWVESLPHNTLVTREFEAWSFRRLGDIHATAGRTEEARVSYDRYLELREDAEPVFDEEIAEVRAARAALD